MRNWRNQFHLRNPEVLFWCMFMVVMSRSVRFGSVGSLRTGVCWFRHEPMALVAGATGEHLVAPFTFTLDRPGLAGFVQRA